MIRSISAIILCSVLSSAAYAQSQDDMWLAQARNRGLFSPHANYCDSSTEVFVAVGGTLDGFCMDKNERSAANWSIAREGCAQDGKRLPEPMEFQFACNNPPSGLINMTNNKEWVSNTTFTFHYYAGTVNVANIAAPVAGNGGCYFGNWDTIAPDHGVPVAHAYRCVR